MATRAMRILAWIGGGLAVLVLLVAGFFVVIFDWNWLRSPIESRAGGAVGRGVAIEGNLDVDLGRVTRIRAERVRVGNPPWTRDPEMARFEAIEIAIRLWPLLSGRVELPDVKLIHPTVALEKNRAGEANWQFSTTAAKVAAPEKRSQFPIIERLVIEDGQLAYRDPASGIHIDSRIHTAVGGDPAHEKVRLSGQGSFKGEPARFNVEAGSLLTLRETKEPYPILVEAAIGATRAKAEGTIDEPLKMAGVYLDLALSGQDMAAVFPLFGIPLPPTRPYSISGKLRHDGPNWTFSEARGKVGDSDLSGGLTVVTGGERPILRANLLSKRLALADLAGFIGARPGEKDKPTDRVLPDHPVNLDKLRAMDVDVRFKGQRVEAPGLPMDGLEADLTIQDGLARLDPLAFAIAQGTFAGTVVLDGRQNIPQASMNMTISRMDLHRFLANTRFGPETSGTLAGKLELAGQGRSTAELLAAAHGRATLMMSGGSLSALLMEAAGLDVAEALGFALSEDKRVPVRCLVADFAVTQGNAKAQALVLDTADTVITGGGTIDLGNEHMNLRLEAHPKDPSPLSVRAPVEIGGRLGKPKVTIDAKTQAARGGLAIALGALLTPLAALIPFLEPGLGEDRDCGQLIQQAQAPR
ncbi:MAG: AsmA family protein [Rhodospirillaceae bacterium]|nr:AsmA family protein [Rhodospirillales bacterium]